ncbi:ATP-grasp domain-containing protein [Cytophaga sp. FL35]|uniref:ATP-grasp domain-containing protein n=1 Tax=Cytophaga sp. FL35 TaxID=1904456 RepID=UPI001653C290|nr:ATP-grasp domain-containing protein [Cytophaga sp. FL35]MBC7000091.1 ATP-grasp domain-containing protein [Cytophaga sp. FL35]
MNVLFTCAGRRNYLIRYFKEVIGENGLTVAADNQATASAFADADLSFLVPPVNDKNYIPAILKIIQNYKIDLLIPLNDLELPIVADHKLQLEQFGTKVVLSNYETIKTFTDKWLTYEFFKSISVCTPQSFLDLKSVKKALHDKDISFPLMIKPRMGSGSVGIMTANDQEELELIYRLQMKKNAKKECLSSLLIQEKINGTEYGMDILNDFNGNYIGAFVRKKLSMRGGETDKAISIIDKRFEKIAKKISKASKHIGSVDCDFFVRNNEIYLLEINPRFGGGYPFSHEAGINVPAIYVAWLNGELNISSYLNYQPQLTFAKCSQIKEVQFVKKSLAKAG